MKSFIQQEESTGTSSSYLTTDVRFLSGRRLKRVLIVGAGDVGQQLADSLEADGTNHVVGFVDDQIQDVAKATWRVLGRRHATAAIVREHQIDEVYIAYAPTWQQMLAEELTANSPHVSIYVVPSPFEAMLRIGGVENRGDIALVRMNPQATRMTEGCKRLLDVTGSFVALVGLSPILLLICAAIRLSSKGPIIFAQERIGRGGVPFRVYKFRTMIDNAEEETGPVRSSGKSDTRLTALGRWLRLFRIDEIPQLWNVLCGEMSLVGPRPERPYFVQKYQCMQPSYARRHQVRPGITGLAQVCGDYHTDARDKLRFDLIYISHQSLWYDLSILARTVRVIIFSATNRSLPASNAQTTARRCHTRKTRKTY